ncbi:MAG: hypothetical protein RLW62_06085, partial [Gammaproteobacteria bacterium]
LRPPNAAMSSACGRTQRESLGSNPNAHVDRRREAPPGSRYWNRFGRNDFDLSWFEWPDIDLSSIFDGIDIDLGL